jgi:hypothetical protein
MKAYWRSGGIAPHIFDLGTRWRWVVSFTPLPLYPQGKRPWYPLDRRLVGPQSRSGGSGVKKSSQPMSGLEPPIIQLIAQCQCHSLHTEDGGSITTRCHDPENRDVNFESHRNGSYYKLFVCNVKRTTAFISPVFISTNLQYGEYQTNCKENIFWLSDSVALCQCLYCSICHWNRTRVDQPL